MVVEILSPATQERDRGVKRKLYARATVGEYWIVDPTAKTVEVLALKSGEYERASFYGVADTLQSPLLPDLRITLSQIF